MACIINSGYTLGCRDNTGGIEFIAIANYNGPLTLTFGTCSLINSFAPTQSFYTFEQYTEQGLANQTGAFDNMNGTGHQVQNITFILEKMDACSREQFLALTQARVRAIVKTQNGKYFLFGFKNGGRASASTAGPGQALNDLSGYSITIEFKEPEPAFEIEETFALSIII
jgi:hypothetical protein